MYGWRPPASTWLCLVQALEDYTAKAGGATAGWSTYDHGIFLKHRARHRAAAASNTATAAALVGKSAHDVAEHEAW